MDLFSFAFQGLPWWRNSQRRRRRQLHGPLGYHVWPEAERERDKLPAGERRALYNAVAKLEAIGLGSGFRIAALCNVLSGCGNCVLVRCVARDEGCIGRSRIGL